MRKLAIAIISILFLSTIGLGSYGLMYHYFSKAKVKTESQNAGKMISTSLSVSSESSSSESSSSSEVNSEEQEETIEEKRQRIGCASFEEYLKSFLNSEDDSKKILDYKINSCTYAKVPSFYEEIDEINDDNFVIELNYNLELYDTNDSYWIPGSDVIRENDWIKGKRNFASIKKENGKYIVEKQFTGW